MEIVFVIFGILMTLISATMIVRPSAIKATLRNSHESVSVHVLAVVVRFIVGALLIYFGDLSKFPSVMHVIGWIAVAAATVLMLMGRRRFVQLMDWATNLSDPYVRFAGCFAAVFGIFLVYAFI